MRIYHILQIEQLPDFHLCLTFDDGEVGTIDLNRTIAIGGIFSKLADPHFFSQVKISKDKRYIQWGESIDFCADALHAEVMAEKKESVPA